MPISDLDLSAPVKPAQPQQPQVGINSIFPQKPKNGVSELATAKPSSPAAPPAAKTPTGQPYTHQRLRALWISQGGDPHVADLMAHVAQAESSGHTGSEGSYTENGKRYYVRGLWQISTIHGQGNWFDPVTNVRKAIELYNAQGMSPWADSKNKGGGGGWGQYAGGDFARGAGEQVPLPPSHHSGVTELAHDGTSALAAPKPTPGSTTAPRDLPMPSIAPGTKPQSTLLPTPVAAKPGADPLWNAFPGQGQQGPRLGPLQTAGVSDLPAVQGGTSELSTGSGGTSQLGGPMDTAGPGPAKAGSPADALAAQQAANALGATGNTIRTGLGRALDAQGYAVRKAVTGEANTDDQMTNLRSRIPGMDWFYQARLPDTGVAALDYLQEAANHASQGLIDAGIQQALDPLTYETFGLSAIPKDTVKAALAIASMRAVDSNALTRSIYDALHWGGAVARERSPAAVQTIRGAANRADATGAMVQRHIDERVDNIVNGKALKSPTTGKVTPGVKLTDQERLNVGKALNGEVTPQELTPREQTAFRQLRTLTNFDYHTRRAVAQSIAFKAYTKDLPAEDRALLQQAFKSGKAPQIPAADKRIRVHFGEPQPRARTIPYSPPPNPDAEWEKAIQGLGQEDKRVLGQALTQPHLASQLPPELAQRLAPVQEALRQKFSLAGGDEHVDLPPQQKSTFRPANQDEIDRMTTLKQRYDTIGRVVDEKVPRREDYMPFEHRAKGESREAFTVNPTEHFDPRTLERPNLVVTSPKQLVRGFRAMASNTNRQVTTRAIHDSLGDLLDDPKIKSLFTETFGATGNKRTDWEQIKDGWRAVIGYPRAATVSFTPRHGFNIVDLVANTVPPEKLPEVMAKGMALAAKLVVASPREYRALTAAGRALGTGAGGFAERKAFMTHFPENIPIPFTEKNIPVPKFLAGKGTGILGKWTAANNRIVWAIDEAFKQVYGEMLESTGEAKGLQAGGMSSERLIDYAHRSPVQNWMRQIAPFGTFRGAIPQAVFGGVARNPARSAFLNRATGGALYGDKPDTGQPGASFSGPTADIGRLLTFGRGGAAKRFTSGPADFARGTIGAPVAGLLGLGQDLIAGPGGPYQHFAMYGEPWKPQMKNGKLDLGFLLNSAIAGVPEAQTMLEAMGIGRFQWRGLALEMLRQSTGINITPAKPQPGP